MSMLVPDSGGGTAVGAPRGGTATAPGDPMLGQQPGELGARQPGHLGQKTSEQTLLSLPLVDIVEPAQGLLDEPIGRSSSATTRSTSWALKELPTCCKVRSRSVWSVTIILR